MSIYEFKGEDAERFARTHGPTRRKGDEIVFERCPYCRGGSKPDKFTFSLNSTAGTFQCKRSSCSAKGNMITLAKDFDFELTEDVRRYYNIKNYNGRFKTFADAHRITESKDEAIAYLQKRGISEAICRKYEITTYKDNKNILVFPFKDSAGELKFIKYRNIEYNGVGNKEWCESNCMPILFGMNHCKEGGKLVVTEGQIDSLTLTECGIDNAVSVPMGKNGFTWLPHCWEWLQKFSEIVVFGDCEEGIVTLADTLKVRFPKKVRVVRAEDYQGYKDANDLYRAKGKAAIVSAIEKSEFTTSGRLKKMSTVEAVNIEKEPCISTGVSEIDAILTGGFHFGGVVVLSGKRGDGKSTWASQLMVEALAQKHNCLIYSGELPNHFAKNWLDRQIIGKNNLTNSEIDRCNDWYNNRLFVYDDSDLADDESQEETLIDIMEQAIVQKNVDFILIDNLMSAMEDTAQTNEALYRAQSDFVGKMAKLARKYNVVILLVAHPRKTPFSSLNNDDISGSADITNKASIVMSYSRVLNKEGNEDDPTKRNLVITKNRLTGKLGEVELYFSEDSKRIVGPDKDFRKQYMTIDLNEIMEISDEELEIPFYG